MHSATRTPPLGSNRLYHLHLWSPFPLPKLCGLLNWALPLPLYQYKIDMFSPYVHKHISASYLLLTLISSQLLINCYILDFPTPLSNIDKSVILGHSSKFQTLILFPLTPIANILLPYFPENKTGLI